MSLFSKMRKTKKSALGLGGSSKKKLPTNLPAGSKVGLTSSVKGTPTPAGKRIGPATPSRTPAASVTKTPARKAAPTVSVDMKRQGTRLSRLARR